MISIFKNSVEGVGNWESIAISPCTARVFKLQIDLSVDHAFGGLSID